MTRPPIARLGWMRGVLACLLLLAVAVPVVASERPITPARVEVPIETAGPYALKTDPALRHVVARWDELQRPGVAASRASAARRLVDEAGWFRLRLDEETGEPVVPTFVKLGDPGAAPALEAEGARIRTRVGDIVVADLPVSQVMAIAARPDVRYLEIAGTSHALLDSSRVRSHTNEVHAGTGLDRAYQGNGVVVGVLDSGIDYTHLDFKTPGGTTRLKGLFDYSNGVNGREWSIGSIDSATSTEYDGHLGGGHGTHVSGTAAGGGRLNPVYRGIAPLADIVFVKGMRDTASGSGFSDADVVAGVEFIFNKARALGEPCVVNLSLGGQIGAHDGTSLYEQALDGLTHPGNIIVAAAGNSNGGYVHAGYTTPNGTTYQEAFETLWFVFPGSTQAIADAWYPSGTIRFGVAVYSKAQPVDFFNPIAGTNPIGPGQTLNNQLVTDGVTNYGRITIDASTTNDPNNGKRRVVFILRDSPGAAPASDYFWTIYAVGNGTFDMWAVTGGGFPPASFYGSVPGYFVAGNNDKSIGTPATARKLISVGSYVTKTQWVDVNGLPRTQGGATLDDISDFSSLGPSADGRTLPNLAAPGEAIIAPLAYTVAGFTAPADIAQGGGYLKMQGTSMAAPHVTGAIALMLERNRYLTAENARAILQGTAVPPLTSNPNIWGAGKLNVQAAMIATPFGVDCGTPVPPGQLVARPADCPEDLVVEPGVLIARPNPTVGATLLAFRLPAAEQVDLAVYDLAGRRVRLLRSEAMPAGTYELAWDGTNDQGVHVKGGVYFARLLTASRSALQRLVVVR